MTKNLLFFHDCSTFIHSCYNLDVHTMFITIRRHERYEKIQSNFQDILLIERGQYEEAIQYIKYIIF